MLADGRRSELLRAIDAGTGTAFMSKQTFHELGRMSAASARGRRVDDGALRELIANDHLPRIPVIASPSEGDGHWVPRADEVSDPDDRPHAQLGVRNLTGYTAWWQLRSKGARQVELDLTAQTLTVF